MSTEHESDHSEPEPHAGTDAESTSTVQEIEAAADVVGSLWPVHSFVTANPLSGFEDRPFAEAVARAGALLGGRGYPDAGTFAAALERGQIDRDRLASELAEVGHDGDPEAALERVAAEAEPAAEPEADADAAAEERVDRTLAKWLSAFLEEGSAHWEMPDREAGFYAAFRGMVGYDGAVPDRGVVTDLPESPVETVETVLEPYPEERWRAIFEEQLTALPGWTGFIKRRAADGGEWQAAYPVSLEGYLAARLALADAFGADIEPAETDDPAPDRADELAGAFLRAWEATYRGELVAAVAEESEALADREPPERPDAQLVFCIDTRSEVFRRHLEATGAYETEGYAGFFGVPMEYQAYDDEVSVAACPPILEPRHHVPEFPTDEETRARHDRLAGLRAAADEVIETLKANAATAYGYVETAGSGYGLSLAARTLVPARVRSLLNAADGAVPDDHEFCEPLVHHQHTYAGDLPVGMTTEEKVEYAAAAVETMGWERFARLVVFTGHAGETANNPYASSLDCGACAGNPGGPSARVLARICNDEEVKAGLRERGHEVPADTVFLAAQHNTTTDEVELYDGHVPESHADELERLRGDLAAARERAASERVGASDGDGAAALAETERRAGDWAETRPEWGLAGNAGFVVGPRALTSGRDLDGRAFLHSYDWSTDPDGDALEAVLTGPLVVTQWINAQYYFSTVAPGVHGSGSKTTQNPVGNVGVYQGNGGDLLTGLPSQSVRAAADEPYHQPLRLSTVVHAPVERVADVLADNAAVKRLLDNDWLSLTVVDPTREHRAFHYEGELTWEPAVELTEELDEEPEPVTPAVADD